MTMEQRQNVNVLLCMIIGIEFKTKVTFLKLLFY